MIKNRQALEVLCKDQLEGHDEQAALELFDELIESGEETEETAFDEVVEAYELEVEEE